MYNFDTKRKEFHVRFTIAFYKPLSEQSNTKISRFFYLFPLPYTIVREVHVTLQLKDDLKIKFTVPLKITG